MSPPRTQKLCQDGAHAFLLYKGLRLTVLRTGSGFSSAPLLFFFYQILTEFSSTMSDSALLVPAFDVPHG